MSQEIKWLLMIFIVGLVGQECLSSPVPDAEQPSDKQVKWLKEDDFAQVTNEQNKLSANVDQLEFCQICSRNFGQFRGHRLECSHPFHQHCILKWVYEVEDVPRGCATCGARAVLIEESKDMVEFLLDQRCEMTQVMRDLWGLAASMDGSHTDRGEPRHPRNLRDNPTN